MTERPHRPTRLPGEAFEHYQGGEDPAELSRIAHETADTLLARVRRDPDPVILDRLLHYAERHGIDAIAELWSSSPPHSLPGSLWRVWLLRELIAQDAEATSLLYRTGIDALATIDPVIAGASVPTGPAELRDLADRILRGAFEGDFALALDRAAAFCRVTAAGATHLADASELISPERATALTTQALRLTTTGEELAVSARLWRAGSLS